MKMKTSVTPICSSSPLPPPLLPWRPVWNGSKPYAPEKTILCLKSGSWPLLSEAQALPPLPHSPGFLQKAAFRPRVGALLSVHRSASTLSPATSHSFIFELAPPSLRVTGLFSRRGADVTVPPPLSAQWHRAPRSPLCFLCLLTHGTGAVEPG